MATCPWSKDPPGPLPCHVFVWPSVVPVANGSLPCDREAFNSCSTLPKIVHLVPCRASDSEFSSRTFKNRFVSGVVLLYPLHSCSTTISDDESSRQNIPAIRRRFHQRRRIYLQVSEASLLSARACEQSRWTFNVRSTKTVGLCSTGASLLFLRNFTKRL